MTYVRTAVRTFTAAAVIVLAGACSTGNGGMVRTMNTELTQDAARLQIEFYLSEVLAGLPEEVSFTRTSPRSGQAFGPGTTVPCDDERVHESWKLSGTFWILGIPEDQTRGYIDTIWTIFDDKGWRGGVEESGSTVSAVVRTQDGYAIRAEDQNHGLLAILGSSPCFPTSGLDDSSKFAETIPHP